MSVKTGKQSAGRGRPLRVPGPVLTLVLALALSPAVSGCAAQGSPQSSEWRLQSLEEASLAAKERTRRQEAEIEALKNRVRALEAGRGPVSVAQPLADEANLPPAPAASEPASPAVSAPYPPIVSNVPPLVSPAPSVPPQAPSQSTNQAMEAIIAQPTAQPEPPAPPAQASPALPASTLYNQGMQAYNAKKFDEARSRFVELATGHPEDKLVPNALYWTGETWYDQRDYAQAILAFKEVPRRFKDHEKTPAALLKIAYCYEKLGDRNNAVFYLRTLVDEFPGKEPVRAAQAKLKELGG